MIRKEKAHARRAALPLNFCFPGCGFATAGVR